MKYTCIPTGIKMEVVKFGVDCDRKGQIIRIVGGGHSFQWVHYFLFLQYRRYQKGAGKKVGEVAGRENGMGVDRIGEVGDRASKGQVA